MFHLSQYVVCCGECSLYGGNNSHLLLFDALKYRPQSRDFKLENPTSQS